MKNCDYQLEIFSFLFSEELRFQDSPTSCSTTEGDIPQQEKNGEGRVRRDGSISGLWLPLLCSGKSVCSDHSWPPAHLSPSKSLSQTWIFRNCQM